MLGMCRQLGFTVEPEPGDNSMKRVRLQLA
jgi:hypothetical protein